MSVIGLRVGPFEIVDEATVPEPGLWFLARRSGITRKQPNEVLVKLLAPDADPEDRAKLQHEFERLRALDDRRIPAAVAFYEGIGALAIDAHTGTSLREIVDARHRGELPMTPPTLLDVLLELAETLQHVHHKGRWHGHLGPHNIALAQDGGLWLHGFGAGPGTPPPAVWLAPERARGEPTSQATDQWSLAAVAVALITGHPPWSGDNAPSSGDDAPSSSNAVLVAARKGDVDAYLDPVDQQWPALGRLLRRMLDPYPQHRFPNLHPVRQELLALARRAAGTSERRELGQRVARSVAARDRDDGVPAQFATSSPVTSPASSDGPRTDVPQAVAVHEPTVLDDLSDSGMSDASAAASHDAIVTLSDEADEPAEPDIPLADDPPSLDLPVMTRTTTARPAAPRASAPLAAERMAVVAPDLSDDPFHDGHSRDRQAGPASHSSGSITSSGSDLEATQVFDADRLLNDPAFASLMDEEPSEPTALFSSRNDPALAAAIANFAQADAVQPSPVRSDRDPSPTSARLAQHARSGGLVEGPTMVPPSDPGISERATRTESTNNDGFAVSFVDESDAERPSIEGTVHDRARIDAALAAHAHARDRAANANRASHPAGNAPSEEPPVPLPSASGDATITRVAPWLALGAVALMALYLLSLLF